MPLAENDEILCGFYQLANKNKTMKPITRKTCVFFLNSVNSYSRYRLFIKSMIKNVIFDH